MSSFTVTLEDNSAAWLNREEKRLQQGLRNMGMAIVKTAQIKRTPKRDNHLRESGHIEGIGNTISVVFGDNNVRYAAVQEAGKCKRNGKLIEFKHYTTPGTGPHYLRDTGDEISKQGLKKFL